MYRDGKIWMSGKDGKLGLLTKMANRHGLIAGASGTGKTITLKVLAEGFSDAGVPVFLADIKGDLAGMCLIGSDNKIIKERLPYFGLEELDYKTFPTCFWDIYGKKGHPLRATISDMGPILLSELLGLSEIQFQVLNVIFRIADDNGLLLIDIKDLKEMLRYVNDNREEFSAEYGNLTSQSIAAIQRSLVTLESLGGDIFFGEPMLDIFDFLRCDSNGKGYINILHSVELSQNKTLYSAFMLWLLSEIYENMPEAGDLDKPRAVLFFDEAHLIFKDAPKVLLEKIEQVIRLIRSKGIGIYFISQSPSDIPDTVLSQLSNKIQHALRAYTPKEQKAIRAVAESFRPNPTFKTEDVITELATGEAIVSFLDETGAPTVVERGYIIAPQSKMGTITDDERNNIINNSQLFVKYNREVDSVSAFEVLSEDREKREEEEKNMSANEKFQKDMEKIKKQRQKTADRIVGNTMSAAGRTIGRTAAKAVTGKSTGLGGTIASTLVGNIGRELGKSITRGIFGSKL